MADKVYIERIDSTIADLTTNLDPLQSAIATDNNSNGYKPYCWKDAAGNLFQCAAVGQDAGFDTITALGDIELDGDLIFYGLGGGSNTLHTDATQTADVSYTLPSDYPASTGLVLTCTDAGVLSWAAGSGVGSVTSPHVPYASAVGVLSDTTMHWDAVNERLGIGTASPGEKLTVYGTNPQIRIDRDAATSLVAFTVKPSGTLSASNVQWSMGMKASSSLWSLWSHNGSADADYITVNTAGNVGIGTTSPSDLLSVFVNQDSGTLATGNAIYAEIDQESGATISAESWLFKGKGDWDGTTTGSCGGLYMELLSGHDYGIYIKEGAGSECLAATSVGIGMVIDSDSFVSIGLFCGNNKTSSIQFSGKDATSSAIITYFESDNTLSFSAQNDVVFTLDGDKDIAIASGKRIKFPNFSLTAGNVQMGWAPVKVDTGSGYIEAWIPIYNAD